MMPSSRDSMDFTLLSFDFFCLFVFTLFTQTLAQLETIGWNEKHRQSIQTMHSVGIEKVLLIKPNDKSFIMIITVILIRFLSFLLCILLKTSSLHERRWFEDFDEPEQRACR